MRTTSLMVVVLLAGCTGESAEPEPQWTDSISFEHDGTDYTGDLLVHTAFSFASGGTGMVYVSSNPDTECDDVVDYLTEDDRKNKPPEILPEGTCNLLMKFDYNSTGEYDGYEVDDDDVYFTANAACAAGDGEWEWTSDNDYDYWGYTGAFYSASPGSHTATFSSDEAEHLNVEINLSDFTGTVAGDLEATEASGDLAGYIVAERCSALTQTPIW